MLLSAWLPCVVITALHYQAPTHHGWLHEVLRRLYYLPILFAAFSEGLRGGVTLAVFASVVYFPHAFTSLVSRDPADALVKGLEIVLYLVVAVVAGLLVDRERGERRTQERLARELREALEEQRRIEAQLIRAGRLGALGELTAGIAHEIKNPLHALKGTAEIFKDVIPAGAPERRMLELHLEEIDRLAQTAERFLAFARPTPADRRPLDLGDVVRRVVALVAAQARKEGVRVGFAPPAAAATVSGDADQLTQLVLNVALNGLQAMASQGGGTLSFTVDAEQRREGRQHVLRVANSGPPVPEALLERIFDPFFTTKDGGTGLGLSIGSRIADQHDGVLAVRNLANGAGVEFSLTLPAL
jgi:signal transduction histidine kinase